MLCGKFLMCKNKAKDFKFWTTQRRDGESQIELIVDTVFCSCVLKGQQNERILILVFKEERDIKIAALLRCW
jgi:hypothetical protein